MQIHLTPPQQPERLSSIINNCEPLASENNVVVSWCLGTTTYFGSENNNGGGVPVYVEE